MIKENHTEDLPKYMCICSYCKLSLLCVWHCIIFGTNLVNIHPKYRRMYFTPEAAFGKNTLHVGMKAFFISYSWRLTDPNFNNLWNKVIEFGQTITTFLEKSCQRTCKKICLKYNTLLNMTYYSSFPCCWLRWWVYKIGIKIFLHWIMFIGVILMAFRLIWVICSTWWNQRLEDNVKGSTNKQWSRKTYRSTERGPFLESGLPFTHLL